MKCMHTQHTSKTRKYPVTAENLKTDICVCVCCFKEDSHTPGHRRVHTKKPGSKCIWSPPSSTHTEHLELNGGWTETNCGLAFVTKHILAKAFVHKESTHTSCDQGPGTDDGSENSVPVYLALSLLRPVTPLFRHAVNNTPLTTRLLFSVRTLASLPIWSSERLLLLRPGVLVGSPPSPSTPGQTFRSCIPCRNMLQQ